MKITILVEDRPGSGELVSEHGLSLLIETGGKKILFDTGQTDAFIKNAEMLGIDLQEVDECVISHGHYDHVGGLSRFLQINKKANVYAREGFDRKLARELETGDFKDIGLDRGSIDFERIRLTRGDEAIGEGLRLVRETERAGIRPLGNAHLKILDEKGRHYIQDDFSHEQSLIITEKDKTVLVTGCSHRGVLGIIEASSLDPDYVIGGFHLGHEKRDRLIRIGEELKKYKSMYFTGHCTSDESYNVLSEILSKRIIKISTGMVIEINTGGETDDRIT